MTRLYPTAPVIGVGVVVWQDDRVLLVRRANPPLQGRWSLPGGKQELGETINEAARREVLEETGIGVAVIGLVDVVDSIHRDDTGRIAYHYTLVDVCARWTGGDPVAGGDAAEAAWIEAARLPGLDLWSESTRILWRGKALLEGAAPTAPGTPG